MLFHFLNFSQCVCLGIKCSTKLQISKSTPMEDILFYFKSLFKDYNEQLVGTKLFSCICDITNCKSRLLKFDWLADGENTWLSTAHFKIEPQCGCFNITVFLMEINYFQKMLDVIFISSCI